MTPFYKIRTYDRGHSIILTQEEFFIKKYSSKLNRIILETESRGEDCKKPRSLISFAYYSSARNCPMWINFDCWGFDFH